MDNLLTLNIQNIGEDGDGVATHNGKKIYVNNTVPGDMVQATIIDEAKTYAHASLVEVVKHSQYRAKAKCRHVLECGGCQIQEMKYDVQLMLKLRRVKEAFQKQSLPTDNIQRTLGCNQAFGFRNKAIYPIARNAEGRIVTGFYARRSHKIIESYNCLIGAPENEQILRTIISHLEKFGIEPYCETTHQGTVRHVIIRKSFVNGQIMVCIVVNGNELPQHQELVDNLLKAQPGIRSITLNVNTEKTNSIKGKNLINLYGNGYITDKIGDIRFKISPLSFYQVNGIQTKRLYSQALEMCKLADNETVLDIYCGVGTISLFLARNAAKVYGVESVESAVNDARENARFNNIENAEFITGKAEDVIPDLVDRQGIKADIVVVDPPRKGCDKSVLDTIIKMKPRRMVYVSCDATSLARDLKYLTDNGFQINDVQPVDMFPHTVHVETVVSITNS
ncbi:MAG: 23S rRNA (uracil(1939)-C(5))-methyltransferase RlmD [Bacteroidales bacterium]|nr:23S rRNA (uracil(1939)-C(5))-methyltransferase RlmD [Bacteroidales bacterium]